MSISVIIPVHNSSQYLDDCINSVIKQAKSDTEIILVENGSTDNTPQLCLDYVRRDERIRYIELGNVGVSVARNEGIKAACGEWIIFLDSDDLLQPFALSLVDNIDGFEGDILISGYDRTYPVISELTLPQIIDKDTLIRAVLQYAKYGSRLKPYIPIDNFNNWACWGKYYKTEFLKKNNVFFPQGIAFSEDAVFCLQAYNAAKIILGVNVVSYYYRPNILSVTNYRNKGLVENNIKLIQFTEEYRRNNIVDGKFSDEFVSFYTAKVIEAIISEKCDYSKLLQNTVIYSAIKKSHFFSLTIGKKNKLKYSVQLLKLKIKALRYREVYNG